MSPISYSQDGSAFLKLHMRDAQAKWDRLTTADLEHIKTKAQLIGAVQERYVLPFEVAADDVEIWSLDRRF